MQMNYRMISSYEYDAISGQYKQVGKQVEDYSSSGDSDFMDVLNKVDKKPSEDALNSTGSFQSNAQNSNLSNYAQMSNVYAYRFRQDEGELSMRAKSASVHNDLTQQGANEQSKNNNTLLNDLLNAI
ncbi:TPA: hypothetical protein RTH03_001552 [Campylobacter jejuni]|nr:hypothetical protein [Campylobacter jejuni]HDZ5084654.1 hypothetical protein [Campylobacter jejuni]HDZ5086220.1 hypothetical protein [Campylobacter jejuni]HDZ5087247.1 hypothetical protein [Campylobacter jejuni]HDZ5090355.1 hypothetical protein [Campylobacter jejuni]